MASSSRSHNAHLKSFTYSVFFCCCDPKDVDSHDSHSNEIGVPLIEVFSVVHIVDDRRAGDHKPSSDYIQLKDDNACSSRKDLDCKTGTSILFVKESDNKVSTNDDGFIVLSKSGIAVPLGSDLIIDFSLFYGGLGIWVVDPISLCAFYDTDFASSTSASSSGSDSDSSNGSDYDFSNRSDYDSKKQFSSPKRDPDEVTYTGSCSAEAMEISDSVMISEYREAPFEVLVKIGQLKDYLYKYLLLQYATGEEQSAAVVGDFFCKTTELKTVSDIVYEDNTGELKKEWIHVPATLKRKDCFSFCLTVEEDKDQQVADHILERYYTIDHVIFDKVDSVVSGNSRKEKGLDQNEPGNIWPLVFSRAQNQQPLLSGLTFNRINVLASSDPLTGLYMCSNGYLVTEVIQFTHEIGQGKDDEIEEPSKIKSCDYVEAVRFTGYPDVPAGKVVYRGKVWNKYKLPPVFALKKTFGGVHMGKQVVKEAESAELPKISLIQISIFLHSSNRQSGNSNLAFRNVVNVVECAELQFKLRSDVTILWFAHNC
ncbi:hypothetical protein POM88_005679 [Heracleum sosnowskyi]|uniref:Uncharacterized protein n=1 Tax=Heracleum sosnowskyi TaxID=360622 RepID=A0AAD8J3Y3_9APIA|nr:hypothetical protein POM88_005679 [Heracleum sosnowskyi]